MDELIFIDGNKVNEPLTRSLFYGEGVFETFRWNNGLPKYISKHLQRLRKGSELLRIPIPDNETILKRIEHAVSHSDSMDLYVKTALISKGDRVFFKNPDESSLLVMTRDYIKSKSSVSICVISQKRNPESVLIRHKTFNYLENIIGRREAIEKGYDEGIFLNTNNDLTEATSSNIFWARGQDLFTPATESGLLPGITREIVIGIAENQGFKINARKFDLSYLLNSDFAFLTNSLMGMTYIEKINKQIMPQMSGSFLKIRDELFAEFGWI